MGQKKGNPTPSYQNEAYETLRPNTGARENRDYGTKPVMIDDNTTLTAVVDATFGTDVDDTNIWNQLGTITGSTFTPNITNGANLFSAAINKTSGYYQKIGNIVQFTMHAEFANAAGQQSGTYQFDLPIAPNNNWSGSWGLVNGTTDIYSTVSTDAGAFSKLYVVNGSKKVYFDGNRGGTTAASTYTYINAQYTINN
jgi:hypothetical protein